MKILFSCLPPSQSLSLSLSAFSAIFFSLIEIHQIFTRLLKGQNANYFSTNAVFIYSYSRTSFFR